LAYKAPCPRAVAVNVGVGSGLAYKAPCPRAVAAGVGVGVGGATGALGTGAAAAGTSARGGSTRSCIRPNHERPGFVAVVLMAVAVSAARSAMLAAVLTPLAAPGISSATSAAVCTPFHQERTLPGIPRSAVIGPADFTKDASCSAISGDMLEADIAYFNIRSSDTPSSRNRRTNASAKGLSSDVFGNTGFCGVLPKGIGLGFGDNPTLSLEPGTAGCAVGINASARFLNTHSLLPSRGGNNESTRCFRHTSERSTPTPET